jgi:predicted RNA-binding protein
MQARNHDLISDDVVAIETNGDKIRVFPGFPQFKLWPDAVKGIGMSPDDLPRLHPRLEKRAHRIQSGFSLEPYSLRGICVLDAGEQVEIAAIGGPEAFLELVRHSYIGRHLSATGSSALHFRQCGAIINGTRIYRLRRPRDLFLMPEIAAILEHNFA